MSINVPCPSGQCVCEPGPFVRELNIAPGLGRLTRQRGRFGDFRRSLLAYSQLTPTPGLYDWAGDDPLDLGLMLVDSFAYLLDILSFYDSEIAQNGYLATAPTPQAARQLTDLLGYVPRPASASNVTVALTATGHDPVTVPRGTAIRSAGFGSEKPQVFELDADTVIDPRLNSLTLAAVRSATFDGHVWLDSGTTAPAAGEHLAFAYGTHRVVMTVDAVVSQKAADGQTYRRVTFTTALPAAATGAAMSTVRLMRFPQSASQTRFTLSSKTTEAVQLDAQYPQIVPGDLVMAQTAADTFVAAKVTTVNNVWANANTAGTAQFAVTEVLLVDDAGATIKSALRVFFGGISLGLLTNPAMTRLTATQLAEDRPLGNALENLTAPPDAIYKGSEAAAFASQVAYGFDSPGHASTVRALQPAQVGATLHTPVNVLGNIARLTRGESVYGEVIGASDGKTAWQAFKLKKKPLTYVMDQGGSGGLVPVITVRVDGIAWTRRDSLVDARATERVYTLRHGYDGETWVVFGEAAIPASGVDNIVVDYRFGAGAAKPPAGLVNSLAGRVPGLGGVAWSLDPVGGSDADGLDSLRTAAPRSMLTFGRAVSLADYEALSLGYPGVVNSSAGWAYANGTQRAQVVIWVVSDQGSVATALAGYLRGLGDGDVPVVVSESVAIATPLHLELRVDPAWLAADVGARVEAALLDPKTGYLAVANRPLTGSLYRSAVVAAIMAVPGVAAVASLVLGGDPALAGVTTPQGHHRVFTPFSLTVLT